MKFNAICWLLATLLVCPLFAQDETPTPDDGADTPAVDEITIELTKNREIKGELSGITNIVLDTKFGEANIPFSEIDGLKLHTDENDSTIVAFKNGDVVTGQLKIEAVSVETDWGDANIKIASIETILMSKDGSFFQDTSAAGKNRWRFGETKVIQQNSRKPTNPQPQPVRQNFIQPSRLGGR